MIKGEFSFEFESHLINYLNKINSELELTKSNIINENEIYCLECKVFIDPILEEGHENHEILQELKEIENNDKINDIFQNLENKYFSLFSGDLDNYELQFESRIDASIKELIEILEKVKDTKIGEIKLFKKNHDIKFQKIKKQYFDLKYKYSNFSMKKDFIINVISNKDKNNTNNNNRNLMKIKPLIDNSVSFSNSNFQIGKNNNSILNKSNLSNNNKFGSQGDNFLKDVIKLINLDLNYQIEIAEKNFEKFLKIEKDNFIEEGNNLEKIFYEFRNQITKIVDKQFLEEIKNEEIPSFDKPLLNRIKKYSFVFEELNNNFFVKKYFNYKNIEKKLSEIESKFILRDISRKDSIDLNYMEKKSSESKQNDTNFLKNIDNNQNLKNEKINSYKNFEYHDFVNKLKKESQDKKNSWNDLLRSNAFSKIESSEKKQYESPSKKIDFSKESISNFNMTESVKIPNNQKMQDVLIRENLLKNAEGSQNSNRNIWNRNYKINEKINDIVNSGSKDIDKNLIKHTVNLIKNIDNPIKLVSSSNNDMNNKNNLEFDERIQSNIKSKKNYVKFNYNSTEKNKIIKSKSSKIINKNKNSRNLINDNDPIKLNNDHLLKNLRNKSNASSSSISFKNHESELKSNLTNISNKFSNSLVSNPMVLTNRKNLLKKYLILSLLDSIEDKGNEDTFRNKNDTLQKIKELSFKDEDNSFSNFNNDYSDEPIIVKIIAGTDELIIYDKLNSETKRLKIDLKKEVLGFDKFLHGCRSVIMDSKIYIAGGKDDQSQYNSFIEYDFKTYEIICLPNMLFARAYFNLLYSSHFKRIYSIGGEQNKSCEYYDLYTKKWTKLPDLNYPRSYINCYFMKKEIDHNTHNLNLKIKEKRFYLYSLFGIKSEITRSEFTDSVEVLEIDKDGDPIEFGWKKVEFDNRSDLDLRNNYARIVPIEQEKLIIVGNCISRYNEKSFAYYDISKGIIQKLNSQMIYGIKKLTEKNIILKKLLTDIPIKDKK